MKAIFRSKFYLKIIKGNPKLKSKWRGILRKWFRIFGVKSSTTWRTSRGGLEEQATLRPRDKCLSH